MNVKIERPQKDICIFQANDVNIDFLHSETFRKKSGRLRGSVMLAGPMLSRFRKAFIPKPGGDKIGRRRLDTHIIGFEKLGAKFTYHEEDGFFHLEAPNLKGTNLLLDEPSVTGTANILMAAVMAGGTTTIYNAACEPYIQQLCKMLNSMGAKITGIGSNMLSVEGVPYLGGTSHTMLPDMIEVGSFIGLAAMTQSDVVIKNAGIKHLGIIPEKFQQLGIQMNFNGDDIHVPEQELAVAHVGHAGRDRHERPHGRDEAGQHQRLAAMLLVEGVGRFESLRVAPERVFVGKQASPEPIAGPVAGADAGDRGHQQHQDQGRQIEDRLAVDVLRGEVAGREQQAIPR
jgi:UDP-N-acetylglucosamine enolpyruvyl transferase